MLRVCAKIAGPMNEYILHGFMYPDAPTSWVLSPAEGECISIKNLLKKFYDLFIEDEPLSYKPLAWVLDPEKEGHRIFGSHNNHILVIYRRNFYVVIEKCFGQIQGPHAARLMYKSDHTGEAVWIGVLQIEQIFYSQERMELLLTEAIKQREFYQSPETEKIIVYV